MPKNNQKILALGLMSGTSMDGINLSMVRTNGIDLDELSINKITPYSKNTLNALYEILKNLPKSLDNQKLLLETGKLVTFDHYQSIKSLLKGVNIKPNIIGFHGQTVYHDPKRNRSIQIGDPNLLSNLLNIKVVGNFRQKDIENGGEGAPIAPIYHKYIIEKFKLELPCCFINIGGVSNLSYWDGKKLIGFDCGPGNSLMDDYMRYRFNLEYDNSGNLAKSGKTRKAIVSKFFEDNFFKMHFPKSLDKLHFNYILEIIKKENFLPQNIMATLSELTVKSIIHSLNLLPNKSLKIYVMGGGIYNHNLINSLKNSCNIKLCIIDDIGLNGSLIEANLIAYLAVRKLRNFPSTFPETTGTSIPTCLGELFVPYKDNFK